MQNTTITYKKINTTDKNYHKLFLAITNHKIALVDGRTPVPNKKNPAYRRQSISWLMWIVAPNTNKILLVRPNSLKKKKIILGGNLTLFMSKSFQIWDHFFPLLFTKDSENLKSLDIGLWKVGVKRPVNRVRNTVTKISCSVRQNLP